MFLDSGSFHCRAAITEEAPAVGSRLRTAVDEVGSHLLLQISLHRSSKFRLTSYSCQCICIWVATSFLQLPGLKAEA
jgi:hypothetical protein